MTTHSQQSVMDVFHVLNQSKIKWILLRNSDDLLPSALPLGKDIDILVKHENLDQLSNFLIRNNFKEIPTPFRKYIFFYGMHCPKLFLSNTSIIVDIASEIFVRSTQRGVLIPLDTQIQSSAWVNQQTTIFNNEKIPVLSDVDLLINLISRCVFDKRKFTDWHQTKIRSLLSIVDTRTTEALLSLVFFKFTPKLLELIQNNHFEMIIDSYFSFKDY